MKELKEHHKQPFSFSGRLLSKIKSMETHTPEKSLTASASPSAIKTILIAWLTAGTLDISMAIIVWSVVLKKIPVVQLCEGISSAVFGKDAFTGGARMVVYGVMFHYIIAFCFAAAYFIVFPYIPFLQKHKVMSGLLYGIFAWAFMKYVVLQFTLIHPSPFNLTNALISIAILMVCIGLPVSLITHRYYSAKQKM